MTMVLITQCLQDDFGDPIGPHDPLPDLVHIGYSQAPRLRRPVTRPSAVTKSGFRKGGTTKLAQQDQFR